MGEGGDGFDVPEPIVPDIPDPGGLGDPTNPLSPNNPLNPEIPVLLADNAGAQSYDGSSSTSYDASNAQPQSAQVSSSYQNDRDDDQLSPEERAFYIAQWQAMQSAKAAASAASTVVQDAATAVSSNVTSLLTNLGDGAHALVDALSGLSGASQPSANATSGPSSSSSPATGGAAPPDVGPNTLGSPAIVPGLQAILPPVAPQMLGGGGVLNLFGGSPGLLPGGSGPNGLASLQTSGFSPWAGSTPSPSALSALQSSAEMGFRDPFPTGTRGATGTARVTSAIGTAIRSNIAEKSIFEALQVRGLTPLIAPSGSNVPGVDMAFYQFWRDEVGTLQATIYGVGSKSTSVGKFESDELKPHYEQEIRNQVRNQLDDGRLQVENPEQAAAIRRALADESRGIEYIRGRVDYSPSGQGRLTLDGEPIADGDYIPGESSFEGPRPYIAPPDDAMEADLSEVMPPGEGPSFLDRPPTTPGFNTQDGVPQGLGGVPATSTVAELAAAMQGAMIVLGIGSIVADVWQAPPGEGFLRGARDSAYFGAAMALSLAMGPELFVAALLASAVVAQTQRGGQDL